MKRILSLAAIAIFSAMMSNCASEPTHVHHYHNTTTTRVVKPTTVKTSSSSPESFQAVTPPSSYSR